MLEFLLYAAIDVTISSQLGCTYSLPVPRYKGYRGTALIIGLGVIQISGSPPCDL